MRPALIALSILRRSPASAVAVALIFVLGLVPGFDNDKYGKVPAAGRGPGDPPRRVEVTVLYEERASYPDRLGSYTGASPPTRASPCSSTAAGISSYEINNVNGTSVGKLTVPEEGDYLVRGRAQARPFDQPALTFGPGIKFGPSPCARSRRRHRPRAVRPVRAAGPRLPSQADPRARAAATLQRPDGRLADAPAAASRRPRRIPTRTCSAWRKIAGWAASRRRTIRRRRQQILDRI